MEKIGWPAAAVVCAALASICVLVNIGQSLTAVGIVIAGLLYGHSLQQSGTKTDLAEVKNQVNGNNRYLVEAMLERDRENRAMLAQALAALPPGTILPAMVEAATKNIDAELLR
jgi:hypothetical protein